MASDRAVRIAVLGVGPEGRDAANVAAQVLATDPEIGYLIMDLDRDVSLEVMDKVKALETSIRTRILY